MIINISRSQQFQQCRRKEKFYSVDKLIADRMPDPLAVGGAYHRGAAVLVATRDREKALGVVEQSYRDELAKYTLLPEEVTLQEQNIELCKRMIEAQAEQYLKDDWTILQPEVEFLVPLPGTEHHCYFCHQVAFPDIRWNQQLPPSIGCSNYNRTCFDHQSHFLKGRSDAVISWKGMLWIMERKTSGVKQNIYWDQWYLSHQLSGYVYGVRKATGMPINGVILEKMNKPNRNQDPFHFDYSPEREPYLRSEADLREFEEEIIQIANDYERCTIENRWYRNPQSCIDYNRRCPYWDACKANGKVQPGQFKQRDLDYVELEYYKILGMEVPKCPVAGSTQ